LSRAEAKTLRRQVQDEIRPSGMISPLEIRRFWAQAAGQARLEAFGTPIGQLLLAGKIGPEHYSAARKWAGLAARYRLAVEAPKLPRTRALERLGSRSVGAASAPGDDVDRVVIDRFHAARSVLLGHGWRTERTVSQCTEELGRLPCGFEELQQLRAGLSALVEFWRIKS
jgi:hypothetical protein